MVLLIAACSLAPTGDSSPGSDTVDTVDTVDTGPDPHEVSGSYKDACGVEIDASSGETGGDALGSLVVVQDGVELGPWTGFGYSYSVGDMYADYLALCIPTGDGAEFGQLAMTLIVRTYSDTALDALTVGAEAAGNLQDIAGLTPAGVGAYVFTAGTASVDPATREGSFLRGQFHVEAEIAVDVDVDVSW